MQQMKACISPSGKLLCLWNAKTIATVHEGQKPITTVHIRAFIFFYQSAPRPRPPHVPVIVNSPSTKGPKWIGSWWVTVGCNFLTLPEWCVLSRGRHVDASRVSPSSSSSRIPSSPCHAPAWTFARSAAPPSTSSSRPSATVPSRARSGPSTGRRRRDSETGQTSLNRFSINWLQKVNTLATWPAPLQDVHLWKAHRTVRSSYLIGR